MKQGLCHAGNCHGVIPISEIVAYLAGEGLLADDVVQDGAAARGISDDSRRVHPGDLYCAIPGHQHDGHDFVADAERAGAVAAVVERRVEGVRIPQIRTTNSRRATAILAQLLLGEPARSLRLVGVTGTNGKTTTVQLARHVLSGRFETGSIGTLGVIDPTGTREQGDLTTPGPVEFARELRDLHDEGAQAVVLEVSSHALDQERVAGVRLDVAAFTNLTRDHLDYHRDLEGYRATKLRLADRVADDGSLVINADDPAWSALLSHPRCLRYGLRANAEYTATDVELRPTGSRWTLQAPDGHAQVQLPLTGEFNITNALAAAAIGGALGLEVQELGEALSTAPSIPGRLEVLTERPFVLRDYAHTPDALRRALQTLRPLTRGRLIVLFGCGGDRDRGKRPLMGAAAAEEADFVIVTSDNPRNEDPDAIIEEILPGLRGAPHERVDDRRAAIARALEIAGPDDVVLLAGKGHETYQIIGDERRPFDESVIVGELHVGREGRS